MHFARMRKFSENVVVEFITIGSELQINLQIKSSLILVMRGIILRLGG